MSIAQHFFKVKPKSIEDVSPESFKAAKFLYQGSGIAIRPFAVRFG